MPGDVSTALVDGQPVETVPLDDRGLNYGDGLFETMAVIDGEVRYLNRHLARLAAGLRRLSIDVPDTAVLRGELRKLSAGRSRAVLKLIVTRGSGARGYAPPAVAVPRRIVIAGAWPQVDPRCYRDGIAVDICRARIGSSRAFAGLKSLNRLDQVMARREIVLRGLDEGIVLDDSDSVIEATAANLFAVAGGAVTTPALLSSGVMGVMRGVVIDTLHAMGVPVREGSLRVGDLLSSDELFLTSSIAGIVPVARLATQAFGSFVVAGRLSRRLENDGLAACG